MSEFKIRAYGRMELAQLYSPQLTDIAAYRKMKKWISLCPGLLQRLYDLGYDENAEYDAAKIEQARMEYEIVEIEAMLRNVVIIDEDNINTDVVNVGNTITVKNKTLNQELTFQIVGSAEANPMEKRISNESPVGKGLLGHKLHETVSIQTPGGPAEFEILNISK